MAENQDQQTKNREKEQLFDLVLPPGTPRSVIRDIITTFDVELVERTEKLTFANMDNDPRNLLAVRGPYDVMLEVEQFYKQKMMEFIE